MTTKSEILKAIRSKCLDCCCYSSNEVSLCKAANCALHSFRAGKDPEPARSFKSPAQAEAFLRVAASKAELTP